MTFGAITQFLINGKGRILAYYCVAVCAGLKALDSDEITPTITILFQMEQARPHW